MAVTELPRLERQTLRTQVYRELRHALMTGIFAPGQAVTLRALAKSLGTSAMPVREAVSRLIAERALEMLSNRSVIVPNMTREKFVELCRARQALEGMVTEQACRNVTPELLRKLKEINADLKSCLASKDVQGSLIKNRDFHFTIYEASRMQVILPIIETLWLQAGPFLRLSLTMPGLRWDAAQHQATMNALKARDPKAARAAIEQDIQDTLEYLLKQAAFDESGDG